MPATGERSIVPAEEKSSEAGTSATDAAKDGASAGGKQAAEELESDEPVRDMATEAVATEPSVVESPAKEAATTDPMAGDRPSAGAAANTAAGGTERLVAGRYRIKRRVGGGAMGVVYLAQDEVLDRTVALKELMLSPRFSKEETEHARKRSFREARLAARLQHRHAITVFNVVEDDGKPVLVMEYLASKSLAEVLAERHRLPPEEVARIGAEVASALAAAHEAGIVHRDVKPGNILIGENGIAKITDFGISRAADDGTLTGSGQFGGTPAFLSPEAARGESPSQAADVFSLGATLYTAVEGRFPYGGIENQMALLYAAAAGRYTPPVQAGPLTGVLSRTMAVDPIERPTMADTARELASVSAPQQQPRRSRRLLFTGLVLLVVVAAGVAAAVLLVPRSQVPNASPPSSAAVSPTTGPPAGDTNTSQSAPTTPAHKTTTITITTTPSASAASPGLSLVDAVSQYYALLPGNLDVGWTKLGPELQKIGKAEYVHYWSELSNVAVIGSPKQVGPNTVEVTIQYDREGERYQETHHLGMMVVDGQPLINTDPAVPNTKVSS